MCIYVYCMCQGKDGNNVIDVIILHCDVRYCLEFRS